MTTPRAYLRAQEIATLCGVSLRTVRRWIATGALPSRKVGGVRLVEKEALETMLSPAPPGDLDTRQEKTVARDAFGKAYHK